MIDPKGEDARGEDGQSQEWHITRFWNGDSARNYSGATVRIDATPSGIVVMFDGPVMKGPMPEAPPGRLWGLWNYDVLECFIVGPLQEYLELEVGPYGHYLALNLDGPRRITDDDVPVVVEWLDAPPNRWRARIVLDEAQLPPKPWRINAYAIHGTEPRQYLAATPVPGNGPDFHRIHLFEVSTLT